MRKILLLSILGLIALSCSKNTTDVTPVSTTTPAPTPTPTVFCKLTKAVMGDFGDYDFTYNAVGKVATVATAFTAGTDKIGVTQTYTYNAAGQPQTGSQKAVVNGKAQPAVNETYTYTGDLLTKIEYFTATGTTAFGVSTLTYDAAKRFTKWVYKNSSSNYESIETYEYDPNGNCTRYVSTDTDKSKVESVYTYDGSKNAEQIATKSLIFKAFAHFPWSVNMALTVKSTYTDATGTDITTGKRTNIKTDAKGYVVSATYTEGDGTVTNETYTLADCN